MKTEQPLWGRGQMVSPQHFQQQAAYAAWSVECIARLGLAQPWGMIEATFEPDALKLGCLQARHLHIRFPDGTLIDTDNADDLPSAHAGAGSDPLVCAPAAAAQTAAETQTGSENRSSRQHVAVRFR